MSEVKWIKITTDIFDDDKLLLIESMPDADALIVIWFKLLCLAGKQNNNGVFLMNDRIPYTDKMLATIFRRKEATVTMALQVFEQFGMIEIVDGVITIPNWGKHQKLDALEKKTAYMRGYMQQYREKQRLLAANGGEDYCKSNSNANVSRADKIRLDKNREEKEKENIKKEKKNDFSSPGDEKQTTRFIPPTVEEVSAYCRERNNGIDPEAFIAHYEASKWMRGNTKIRDWKACVRTWEAKRKDGHRQPAGENAGGNRGKDQKWGISARKLD